MPRTHPPYAPEYRRRIIELARAGRSIDQLELTNTMVVKGEHRLYEPNGALKEVRPVGSYTSSPPGDPHREGAGDEGGVVFYSVRGKDGTLFEVLDDDLKVVGTLSMTDFVDAL